MIPRTSCRRTFCVLRRINYTFLTTLTEIVKNKSKFEAIIHPHVIMKVRICVYNKRMFETLFLGSQIDFIFNMVLSVVVGFIIGLERESKGKDAGVSTHTLVILGSMLFSFLSIHAPGTDSTTRIAAQVVTGIGFLGAGLILKDGISVRNLTTAASLWFSAALGMAIGFGFHIVAILSAVIGILILRIPHISHTGVRESQQHE